MRKGIFRIAINVSYWARRRHSTGDVEESAFGGIADTIFMVPESLLFARKRTLKPKIKQIKPRHITHSFMNLKI